MKKDFGFPLPEKAIGVSGLDFSLLMGDFTFAQKKYLLNMKLPHNLKSIGQREFSNCGRLCGTLELPASVTAIEFGAFMGFDNLRYVLAKKI